MGQSAEHGCLERMCGLIAANEDEILRMVTDAASVDGVEGSRSPGAWRESVRGVSDAVFQAVYGHLEVAEDGPRHDPVVAYGIVRARTQAEGVAPSDRVRLLRHHRRAYAQLVKSADFPPEELIVCRRFLDWVFDRLEDGFAKGHSAQPSEGREVAGT